ncbi:MAG: hypothetical protein HPY90_04625 [Syntrophothermus sp.]|uniref:hypothetical protein n=1 Tax=Syntrophothermus sp. TaxID=2736299 RepID=UPI00257F2F1E|nr:hypothetical protein [Syntrophothermus sp.]NSW82552.1 hypothetical protein [Syntrophothermus sp.]
MNKLMRNRNRYTGDNPGTEVQERYNHNYTPRQRYCIEIKTGPREKIKLSFAYSAMRQGLLEKLGQAKEELEIRLFTETESAEVTE